VAKIEVRAESQAELDEILLTLNAALNQYQSSLPAATGEASRNSPQRSVLLTRMSASLHSEQLIQIQRKPES
jgi:hypothetical protein